MRSECRTSDASPRPRRGLGALAPLLLGTLVGSSIGGGCTAPGSGEDETLSSDTITATSGPSSSASEPSTDGSQSETQGSADETAEGGPTDGMPPDVPPVIPGGYYVEGNAIYDDQGNVHVFRGVARPSLEWNNQGEGLNPQDYQFMASWGTNVVRIALNQGFWLEGSVAYAPGYPETVDQQIDWAHAAGLDVILDLHWSDRGDYGVTPGQQRMADNHSVLFWDQVADRYKDDGRVLFELYNEPHDVPWQVWRDGGDSGDGFTVVGMQTLYDTVRATGAENIVIVGGLDFAYDLSGVPGTPLSGYNIAYATHPYDFGNKQPAAWEADWGFLTATHPVLVTEFGSFECGSQYASALIDYAAQRNLSWTAWAWYPGGCGFPSLITDWAATPSEVGQVVRTALMAGG